MDLQVGLTVRVAPGDGVIRWLGENPPFATGSWVGVELFEPGGKNDGSVKGQRFFECKPNHGAFVRPSQVRVLAQAAATAGTAAAKPTTPSATPAPRAAGAASRPGLTHASTASAATTSAPARPSPPRASTARPAVNWPAGSPTPSRSGTPGTIPGRSEETPARRGAVKSGLGGAIAGGARAGGLSRTTSLASAQSAESGYGAGATAPWLSVAQEPRSSRPPSSAAVLSAAGSRAPSRLSTTEEGQTNSAPVPESPAASAAQDATSAGRPTVTAATAREVDELRIKLRLLEARRADDQDRIKGLELKAIEAENFAQARVKLQARFTELAQQLTDHRKHVRDLSVENEQLKSHEADVLDQLEVATIDKELAEETAEAQARQVEELQTRIEELQTQVEVFEMQGEADDAQPSEGAAASAALARAQTENDKLREALGKLRDRLLTTERESRQRIAELEKDLRHSEDLLTKYNTACVKLDSAEGQISDLKQQLDNALGAEEMLEQLTERTLFMGERIEEMRITIEDLEALKEMNDELEEGHVEAEKQLQREFDSVTSRLSQEARNVEALKAAVVDREATISQFRDLVQAQTEDIQSLRCANDMQQNETADMASKSQAVLNMNLKLQNTAVKSQARLIASEVAKFELAQAEEQLHIVQSYLPSAYFEVDHHATAHLLFWHRLTAKTELLVNTISQVHNLPDALQEARSEKLIGVCELLGLLRRFATITKQFSGIIRRSSSEDYMALSKTLPDVLSLEKPFDTWIELMKRDEFQEQDCALEFQGLLAHIEHLATTVFANDQLDLCERQLGFAVAFDADLDNFAAAVGFARHACVAVSSEEDIDVEVDDVSFEDGIYLPVQRILDQVRLVKISSIRLLERMRELEGQSASLGGEMHIALRMLSSSVSQATDVAVRLAQMVAGHVADLREHKTPLVYANILAYLRQVTAGVAAGQDVQPWDIIGMFITRVANDVNDLLPKIREAQEQGQVTKILVEPPWTARVEALKSLSALNADAEIRASRLATQIKDLVREVKTRDQSLQEAGVKIELMERKVDTVRKQAETIVELEGSVSKALAKEKAMQDALDHLQKELDGLESENDKLRQNDGGAGGTDRNLSSSVMRSSSMVFEAPSATGATSRPAMASDQISTLHSAIRHLRAENAYLKAQGLLGEIAQLPMLPTYEADPPVPALDSADSSDESTDGPPTPPPAHDRGPSRHAMHTRTKLLWRELADSTLETRVVDLSRIKPGQAWRPIKALPEVQLEETRRQRERLQRRIERHVAAAQARRSHESY